MNRSLALLTLALSAPAAYAFCGFYVAQADASLYNHASQVVLARDGNRTTMTMANDYDGPLSEFAMVIPVPVPVKREQVQVSDKALVDAVDKFSGPRLTEYYDDDPCPEPYALAEKALGYGVPTAAAPMMDEERASGAKRKHGVTVLDSYQVGEYDILILSARESEGLQAWLTENGYRIPDGAGDVLTSYIRQNMKFFVAKVNMKEKARVDSPYLRPLRVSYESPKFMLPIRLGMANARGTQELFVYTLTPRGRVEATNYRTSRLPSGLEVPEYVAQDFGKFYASLFDRQVARQGMDTVFTEYAWPLTVMCDPCSADPIPVDQLQKLGADWADGSKGTAAYLTRLHVRYDWAHFPEDLAFQETPDQTAWQAIYTIRHPFEGDTSCSAGQTYRKELQARREREVKNLSSLTGWPTSTIWSRMGIERTDGGGDDGFWNWR